MKLLFSKKEGITLIALIITIIILLILAGVTISTVIGDNGILNQAVNAADKTQESVEDELRKLTSLEAATNIEDTKYTETITQSGTNGTEENITITVTIPAGFAISKVEGENSLKNGLVIIDSKCNEYVWVIVPTSITSDANTTEEIYNSLSEYAQDYRTPNYSDDWYDGNGRTINEGADLTDTSGCGLTYSEYYELYENMLNSIKQNGGFWIARYEMGDSVSTQKNEARTSESGYNNTAVIQANQIPYHYITLAQGQELASNMYSGNLTSSLMFGIQYDLVMKFIETNDKNISYEDLTSNAGILYGNYNENLWTISNKKAKYSMNGIYSNCPYTKTVASSVLVTTGSNVNWAQLNIFDLFGNCWEMTLEQYNPGTMYPCTVRGSSSWDKIYYASARQLLSANDSNNFVPRVVMF